MWYSEPMRKLRTKPTTLLGFFAFFLPLFAQAEGHSVGLIVGQVWPAGEIGKNVDGTVAPGLSYEYAASDVFSVYASGIHSSHNDGALKMLSTNVGIKAHLVYFDKLAPYALVGAGLYFVKKQIATTRETAKKTNFGLHLGLGAELDLSELFFIGLEFDIHNLFAGTVQLPVNGRTEISGRWTGFFLRGGVRF